jgi:hypothetical protein
MKGTYMSWFSRHSQPAFALATLAAVLSTGCTVHAGYYDPYYHDRHPWNGEVVYYQRWETETHREHRDFKKRNEAEQKEYWDWRHHQH